MISRRKFVVGAFLAARPGRVVLEAISAATLPHTIVVPRRKDLSGVFELREYRLTRSVPLDGLQTAFAHSGIESGETYFRWSGEQLCYLFRFDSLAARAEAWTLFASHPDWRQIRDAVQLTGVSLYKSAV